MLREESEAQNMVHQDDDYQFMYGRKATYMTQAETNHGDMDGGQILNNL